MDPRLRTLLFGLAASALAAWVGLTLANEEHGPATLLAALAVWAILSWTRGPLAESWLLGFLVFGYVIGNRGFAQVAPVPGLPMFFGELGLGVVGTLVLFRGALRRDLPVRRDWLNGLLLFWAALAAARIAWDVRAFGLLALRDFALVYYALYFFAVQAIAAHAPSRGVLRGALQLTFIVLPFTGAVFVFFPEFAQGNLLVRGVPLVYYKADLLATFLFAGYVLLLPVRAFDQRDAWRWLLAIASLVLGLGLLSRASLAGLLVALGWLGLAGRWRPLRVLVAVGAAGLLAVTVYSLLQRKDFQQTKAYAIYESVLSVADFSGSHDYRSEQSGNKGDNNRFRLVWWRNVATETLTTSPVLGLGFGADLARGFLLEYYPDSEEEFTTRSPHNVFMTVLGRMGLVGVAAFGAIYLVILRGTARLARQARGDPARLEALTLHAGCWVIMVSACFGVVLEGPMGAIPFWIMLGLAHWLAADAAAAAVPVPAPIAPLPAARTGV